MRILPYFPVGPFTSQMNADTCNNRRFVFNTKRCEMKTKNKNVLLRDCEAVLQFNNRMFVGLLET